MVQKNPIIWDVDISAVISILVETKDNSKYLTEYLDKIIRPLILILPKMSGYDETFKFKDRDKDKKVFLQSDNNILEKYRTIWTEIKTYKIFN